MIKGSRDEPQTSTGGTDSFQQLPVATTRRSDQDNSNQQTGAGEKSPEAETSQPTTSSQISNLEPPVVQFAINLLLQLAAFVAAIAFGIYAVKSVRVGNQANGYADQAVDLAIMANRLTLLTLCLSNNNLTANLTNVCAPVIDSVDYTLPDIVSVLFPGLGAPPPGLGTGSAVLAGIIIGVILAIAIAIGVCWACFWRQRQSMALTKFRRLFMDTRVVPAH